MEKQKKHMNELEAVKNMRKCPFFDLCSKNICPLDYNLKFRVGSDKDKCKWMRGHRLKKVNGKTFTSGDTIMPDGSLKFVPECNLKHLNKPSQDRWLELNKNNDNRNE